MHKNLWPDIDLAQAPRSPKAVIEEAGSGLGEKTNGLVDFSTAPASIDYDVVKLSCSFYVESLSYYFPFMRAKWSVDSNYPVALAADKLEDTVVENEGELSEALAKIFRAPSTIETIQRLMFLAQ